MVKAILGARIRERRRQIGLTQVELARRSGISASYLNLIERNRRGIGGALLNRIAQELNMRADDLDGVAEQRLLDELRDATSQPQLANFGLEPENASDFLGRFPAWANAFSAVMRSERRAIDLARTLSDRLSHDPFLGETVHQMLTRIAAVRSASEILNEVRDVTPVQRARFDAIIHTESRALSAVGEALAGYFDKVDEPEQAVTPQDEVEAFFDAHQNSFPRIEAAAEPRRSALQPEDDRALERCIEDLVSADPRLQTAPSRDRARKALQDYAGLATKVPLADLLAEARGCGFDLQVLCDRFGVTTDAMCKRLTALTPADDVPLFGYVCANASGNILELRSHPALSVPRHTGACPLWLVFRAQQDPHRIARQVVVVPTGRRFVFVATARAHGQIGYGQPRHFQTDMLVLSEADAAHTVYAVQPAEPVETIGTACRICPHADCLHRTSDPFSG